MTAGVKASIKKMVGAEELDMIEPWHAAIREPIHFNNTWGFKQHHGWFETHAEALAFVTQRLTPKPPAQLKLVDGVLLVGKVSTHRNAGLLREMGHDV